MKPFNLEEAKSGKPLITRNGQSVKFVAHVPELEKEYESLIVFNYGSTAVNNYFNDGSYFSLGGRDDDPASIDLFMAPTVKTLYMNLYENIHTGIYFTAEGQIDSDKDYVLKSKYREDPSYKFVKMIEFEIEE